MTPVVSPGEGRDGGHPGRRTLAYDLVAIDACLRDVASGHPRLEDGGDPFEEDVVAHMVEGYGLVQELLAEGIDCFAMGNLKWLLELNMIALCGRSGGSHACDPRLYAATRDRFYDERGAGVRDLVEWLEAHRSEPATRRAAGAYARVIANPQLFVEGNHRTACLVASLILGRAGEPPFVISRPIIDPLLAACARVETIDKRGLLQRFRMSAAIAALAPLIAAGSSPDYLKA